MIQMVFAAFSFSLMATFAKLGCETTPFIWLVFFRSLFGTLLMGLWLARKKITWTTKRPVILILRGLFGFGALTLHFYTIGRINLGTAVMLNYTSPIFVVIIAYLVLKEQVTKFIVAIVLISFVGLYLLAAPEFEAKPLPIFLGILSGISAAFAYIMIRFTRRSESPYTVIFYFTLVSTFASIPFVFPHLHSLSSIDLVAMAGVTMSAFFGQIFLTKSIQDAPVSLVLPFSYLTPVFAAIFAALFWKEYPTVKTLIGSSIIVASGASLYLMRTKRAYVPLEE